ncbi:hypothetical protein JCM9957A_03850 [Kineosporia succinea]
MLSPGSGAVLSPGTVSLCAIPRPSVRSGQREFGTRGRTDWCRLRIGVGHSQSFFLKRAQSPTLIPAMADSAK